MIDDLRHSGAGPPLEADICLVGAGAAGISIAREFAGSRLKICLVESGGLDFDAETQRLYDGENVGLPQSGMEVGRLRYFGGTTNHWGGRCTRLDPLDFALRPWVSYSGWPITRAELDPYYDRARLVCGLGARRAPQAVIAALGVSLPALDPSRLRPKIWQYTPTDAHGAWDFGRVYREEMRQAENIHVLLHANLTHIAANEEASLVDSITVTALHGVSRQIRARAYVLCCGAIENARLLLATAEGGRPALGNAYDLVGRFYMDHLRGQTALLFTAERLPAVEDCFNFFMTRDGRQYQIGIALSEAAQRRRELLNCCAILEYNGDPRSGIAAAQAIWRGLEQGRWVDGIGEKVWRVVRDMEGVTSNLRRRLVLGRHPLMPLKSAAIIIDLEQAPNPDSRITLSGEKNALGQPEPRLDWRVGELELRTAEQFSKLAGVEMARLDLGRCRLDPWLVEPARGWATNLTETFHQTGTTRMASDPRQGVVDATCRVHGIGNLYVAGSSVFPTGGHANPTLTLVALALRLSDHLKARLG